MARTITGVVSSDKGSKTIIVTVHTHKTHPLYKKQYSFSRKFMAHDEKEAAQVGDTVTIRETKPLSARKRYMLDKVVEKAGVTHVEAAPELPIKEKPADKPAIKKTDKPNDQKEEK